MSYQFSYDETSVTFSLNYKPTDIKRTTKFHIYTLTSDLALQVETFPNFEPCNFRIVELLPRSHLVAVVSWETPNKVSFENIRENREIAKKDYSDNIRSVKLSQSLLVVCLKEYIYIYSKEDAQQLGMIPCTPNQDGLLALSTSEKNLIAYPGSIDAGIVHIYDVNELKEKVTISAHKNPITALQFNESATMIATASIKGTVIRIFNVDDGTKLHEFWQTYGQANVFSLSFSSGSQFLLCSSFQEVVHIFKLEKTLKEKEQSEESGFVSWMTKIASYLYPSLSDILNREWAIKRVKLNSEPFRITGAMVMVQNRPRILVGTSDLFLKIYNFNTNDISGLCKYITEHRLFYIKKFSFWSWLFLL